MPLAFEGLALVLALVRLARAPAALAGLAWLALLAFVAACTLPAGVPCCSEDIECDDGARCFENRCALLCDDGSQCAEGETCLDVGVCRRVVRAGERPSEDAECGP